MATRNDRETGRNGRNQHGIGSFEQQQWSGGERERPQSRDIEGRFSRSDDRRNSMFGRSHDEQEDPELGQRREHDEHRDRDYPDRDPRGRDERSYMSRDRDDRYHDDRDRGERQREDDDRSWFDRARDNVRDWFRREDDTDRSDRDDRGRDEGRGDHQVYAGRGLQSYDDPRRVREDEQRRFGRDRDTAYSREEQRWFHHPERPGEDERLGYGPRAIRDDDRNRELGTSDYSRHRGWSDEGIERSSLGGVRDRNQHGDIRVRAEMRRADRERYGNLPEDRYHRDGLYRDVRDERHRFADTDDDTRRNWSGWSGRSDRDETPPHRAPIARDERSRLAPQRYDERYGHPSTRGNRLDYDQQFASHTERGEDNRASTTRGRDEDQDRSFVPRDEYGRRRR